MQEVMYFKLDKYVRCTFDRKKVVISICRTAKDDTHKRHLEEISKDGFVSVKLFTSHQGQ